eukprot:TRINITY_DN9108_c0_g5_i1.p1 TRINITY_DN9108_c0_g5~~TRINITY_DN9108_c0_g5_i1.p1  ORF type:complete len:393 (+),score=86.50 TRINITY_DN9108_c0_g5_i1:102-1280(+)
MIAAGRPGSVLLMPPAAGGHGVPLAQSQEARVRAAAIRFGGVNGGLPELSSISSKKAELIAECQNRLAGETEAMKKQLADQSAKLHDSANQEKIRFKLALDQKVKSEEFQMSQQYNAQLMKLQQTAQAKRAELEQQATNMVLQFQQKKLEEEFLAQQKSIQDQHQDAQKRLSDELSRVLGESSAGNGGLSGVGISAAESAFAGCLSGNVPALSAAGPGGLGVPGDPKAMPGNLTATLSSLPSFASRGGMASAMSMSVPSFATVPHAAYSAPPRAITPLSRGGASWHAPSPSRTLQYVPPDRSLSFNSLPGNLNASMSRAFSWSNQPGSPTPQARSRAVSQEPRTSMTPQFAMGVSPSADALASVLGGTPGLPSPMSPPRWATPGQPRRQLGF